MLIATAAGTPALAIFVISSRRVIATSVLFPSHWLSRGLLGFHPSGFDSFRAHLLTALEPLRVDIGSAAECASHSANQSSASHRSAADRVETWRISIGRSRQMNLNGLKGPHLPDHIFFGATHAGNARADRPAIRNFIEVPSGAGGMSNRTLAAHLIKAPALAMAFVAKRHGKAPRVKVCAPRTVLMNHALI